MWIVEIERRNRRREKITPEKHEFKFKREAEAFQKGLATASELYELTLLPGFEVKT